MRIANEQHLPERSAVFRGAALLIALGAGFVLLPQDARADQSPMMIAPPPMMPMSGMNLSGTAPAPVTTLPAPISPMSSNLASADIGRNISALEDKASDNAKNVVKHLDNSSDAMTLEDLNTARQAVARLDAMIDVEKHLAELDKVRSERGGGSMGRSLAGAIPASALTPPPSMQNAAPVPRVAEKPKTAVGDIEISRIIGTDGKYSAVLKMPNGDVRPVRIGDTVSDHATVRWISASTVLIEENGATHTLRIKNVNAIYSAMR